MTVKRTSECGFDGLQRDRLQQAAVRGDWVAALRCQEVRRSHTGVRMKRSTCTVTTSPGTSERGATRWVRPPRVTVTSCSYAAALQHTHGVHTLMKDTGAYLSRLTARLALNSVKSSRPMQSAMTTIAVIASPNSAHTPNRMATTISSCSANQRETAAGMSEGAQYQN